MTVTDAASQTTRELVIAAAIRLFGRNGYDATSVRQIAREAGGQNVALVSYYFGSKDGLRRACAEAIVARMSSVLPGEGGDTPELDREAACTRIEAFCFAVLDYMTLVPEAQDVAAFMLRELAAPGEVFDIVYTGLIEARHGAVCRLWAIATDSDATSAETRLTVFALLGQILYFRIGRTVVQRRLGWEAIGPAEVAQIKAVLRINLRAAIAAHAKAMP